MTIASFEKEFRVAGYIHQWSWSPAAIDNRDLVLLLDVIATIHDNTTDGPMPSYFYHLLFELYTPRSPYCRSLSEFLHLSSQQLSSLPCWIPPQTIDVFTADLPSHPKQRLPAHSDLSKLKLKNSRQTNKSKSKEKESRPNRHLDWRFGRVRVESIDMAPAATDGERKESIRGASPSPLTTGSAASKARFICLGDKNTEFGYGVVHLYRDEHETLGLMDAEQTEGLDEALTTVAILAVPSYMTPSDFVGFVGEGTRDAVSHIRMIRTGKANRYMVLMKFRDKDDARIFVKEFNGKVFNSMEPENCHVVYIKSIQFTSPSATIIAHQRPGVFPEITNDPFSPSHSPTHLPAEPSTSPAISQLTTKAPPPPTPSLLELPTCPVCLERMDETTGLLTILCQHVFHCACLSKWKDSSCPVCRYTQSSRPPRAPSFPSDSEEEDEAFCATCVATQNLWICLICGNVGCGRYDDAHAFEHYKLTSHCYAMDIETQRVWDYAGDGYVHRLIQNKSDGKLVELPSSSAAAEAVEGEMVPREKIENMGLEYTYLLTSQLDSQRLYYEEKTAKAADKASSAIASAEKAAAEAAAALASLHSLEMEYARLTEEVLPELEKGRARAEAKVAKHTELARKMEKEWREEKRVGEGLLERVKHLDKENEDRGKEVAELKEQVRDLMFFLQAREKMEDAEEEVVEGTVTVGDAPREGGKRRKGKGKR